MIRSNAIDAFPHCRHQINKIFFSILCLWVFISALYYLNFLLTGDVSPARNQGFVQSALKQIVCFGLSLSLLVYSKSYLLAIISFSSFALMGFVHTFKADFELSVGAVFFVELIITIFSLLGFSVLLRLLTKNQKKTLVFIFIAWTGTAVSAFSVLETTYMVNVFRQYWDNTEGMRSVSTLLNPNNMGIYVGFCLILLFFSELRYKIIYFFILLYPLLTSGSRTSWVGLVFIFSLIYLRRLLISKKIRPAQMFLTVSFMIGFFICLIFGVNFSEFNIGGFDLAGRLTNSTNSGARLIKYHDFIYGINFDYLFPDFKNVRAVLVSESAYFTVINYLGLLLFLFIFMSFLMFFAFKPSGDREDVVWKYVFVYYIVVSFFESTITSFPNNQVMFISIGAFYVCRNNFRINVGGLSGAR